MFKNTNIQPGYFSAQGIKPEGGHSSESILDKDPEPLGDKQQKAASRLYAVSSSVLASRDLSRTRSDDKFNRK